MNKTVAIGALSASALLIAGCAVPVPVQVASWALDGISYLLTEKSVTDHGLSMVAEKDCAVWRGVTEGELCREWQEGGGTLVAGNAKPESAPSLAPRRPVITAGFAPAARSDIPPLDTDLDTGLPDVEELVNFVTAAGPAPEQTASSVTRPLHAMAAPAATPAPRAKAYRQTVRLAAGPAVEPPATAKVLVRPQVKVQVKTPIKAPPKIKAPLKIKAQAKVKPITVRAKPSVVRAANLRAEPAAGIYFVIGSFRNYINARALAGHFGALVPAVLAAKLDGAPVYRVVVGPATPGAEKALHRRVAQAGLLDTWAIRVTPGDWTIARAVIARKRRAGLGGELAALPR